MTTISLVATLFILMVLVFMMGVRYGKKNHVEKNLPIPSREAPVHKPSAPVSASHPVKKGAVQSEQSVRILARSMYGELKRYGHGPQQIVALATELIVLVQDELEKPASSQLERRFHSGVGKEENRKQQS